MTVTEWLDSKLYKNQDITVAERIVELLSYNGGTPNVRGWGTISYDGPLGKSGLEQEEALQLIYLHGMILDYEETLMKQGFNFVNPNSSKSCGCGSSFSA